jgi:hypothetical protein
VAVKRFISPAALAFASGVVACASPYETRTVVGPSTLDPAGIEIVVETPSNRPKTSLDLCVEVEGRYQFDREKGTVSPQSGPRAELRIESRGVAGASRHPHPSGHFLDLRSLCWPFEGGPLGPGERVMLTADPPFRVHRVYWMWAEYH